MGWFKKKCRPQMQIVSSTVVNGAGQIISESSGLIEPMSDERYAQILREIDEFKAKRVAFEVEGQVRGKHFTDWIPELDRLRSEKRDDESLVLLREILPMVERANRAWGNTPGGSYDTRIAVILRRRKDYAGEVAVLEAFLKRNPDYAGDRIQPRLDKARDLATRHEDR